MIPRLLHKAVSACDTDRTAFHQSRQQQPEQEYFTLMKVLTTTLEANCLHLPSPAFDSVLRCGNEVHIHQCPAFVREQSPVGFVKLYARYYFSSCTHYGNYYLSIKKDNEIINYSWFSTELETT